MLVHAFSWKRDSITIDEVNKSHKQTSRLK